MSDNSKIYFAADKPEVVVETLNERANEWFKGVSRISYIDKIRRSWEAYHGEFYADQGGGAHEITFGGEDGELVNLAVNHYRNIARHILNIVTGTRPAFQCRAINTDRKSLIQAKLGNGLLDYYMREMRLEQVLKDAVEYAIVLGSGYIKLEWNSTKGEIYDYIEPDKANISSYDDEGNPLDENGIVLRPFPVYQGDVEFTLLSPFDIVFDRTKEYFDRNEWIICRDFVNKHDLAAKYPELANKILDVTPDSVKNRTSKYTSFDKDRGDDIPVYEFYHKRTNAMPEGRYLFYINNEIILEDTVMPYRRLPIYRIVPSSILGTPYGYTDMFDLLPLQQFLNSTYSSIATNINAFGIQNIISPRGANVEAEQVSDGLRFIEYNAQAGGKPEALNLLSVSPELYKMLAMIEKAMETLSGMNSVVRGSPEQSSALRSGNALALVQSQALQFVSTLQQSYIRLVEDIGTGLINLLKDFAQVPRIAAIAGLNNATEMTEFKSDNIKSINRVIVDAGNALMQSSAGRAQVAENLVQMGLIDNVDKYLMVLNTGNLDYLTDGKIDNLTLIKAENEALIRGERQQAIWSERHSMHIKEHMEVLNDPKLKTDPNLVQMVLDHVQEHVQLLKTTDPAILSMIGEQPILPPPPAPMAPPVAPPPADTNQAVPVDNSNAEMMPLPDATSGMDMPSLPEPAGVKEGIIPPRPKTPSEM